MIDRARTPAVDAARRRQQECPEVKPIIAGAADKPLPALEGEPRRREPRWLTVADLAVIVAGVALAITVPSQPMGAVLFFAPPPLIFLVLVMGLRLTMSCGLVLALVVLFRRWRYGGPVWPAEWLALLLASFLLVEAVPPLDAAVNAYYRAVGSSALDFGLARWLLSAPAAAGVLLVVAGLAFLRPRVRRVACRVGGHCCRHRRRLVPLVLGSVRGGSS